MPSPLRLQINLLLRQAKDKYALAPMWCAVTDLERNDDPHALDKSFQLQEEARELTKEAFRLMEQEDRYAEPLIDRFAHVPNLTPRN